MTNHTPRSKAQLQLIITAVEDNAKVTVKASIINYVKVQTLRLGQKVTVTIPSGCELNSQQKNLCSVIVRASADVSITAYNHKTRTTDTALIYPTTELGREYYVLTPPKHQGKEFSITNYKKSNKVTVFVQSHVWYKGAMYRKGTKLTLNLKPYESVFFQSNDDLTGTRVTAQQPVAVFTGHACTTVLFKYCNHVYEQLLPVNKWGSTYIVPPFPEQSRYDVVYVTASRLTEIRVRSGKRKYSRSLSAGQTQFFKTSKGSPLSLQANNGIQVIMFFSGIKKYVNRDLVYYDAFMLSVLSTDKYCSHYSLGPLKDFDNEALIVAPTTAMSKLTLDNKPLPKSAWKHIPETPYVWTQIDANRGKILSSSSVPFALYSVGFANRNGYGSAGQCAQPGKMHYSEFSKENTPILLKKMKMNKVLLFILQVCQKSPLQSPRLSPPLRPLHAGPWETPTTIPLMGDVLTSWVPAPTSLLKTVSQIISSSSSRCSPKTRTEGTAGCRMLA